jgi:hypothetical protein
MHICSGNKGTWKPRQKKIDYIEIDRNDYLKTTTEIKQKFEDFVVRNPVVAFLRLLFLNLLISYMWRFLHVLIISNYFCNFLSSVYSFHFPTKNKKVQLVLQEALKMRNEIGLFGFTILSSTILKCVISKRDLFDKITM